MRAIIGLGNPEEKHQQTRHNVGFMVVEALADQLGIALKDSPKLFAKIAKNDNYLLVQPQTYMNDSGRAVRAVLDFYKLTADELWVVHDDLDIPLGDYKTQLGKGPKAHNGLLSIYQTLGTKDFQHVRIGTEGRENQASSSGRDYVLTSFQPAEMTTIKTVIGQVVQELLP